MAITTLPPDIVQSFNTYLLNAPLDHIEYLMRRVEKIIIPNYKKKCRPQDTGKKREFEKLLAKFYEVYERKKIEKEKQEKKDKESRERFRASNEGCTVKFRRMELL